jgi:hypothetical protein
MTLEGWDHIPEGYAARFDLTSAPWWLRWWHATPFVDRYAYPRLVARGFGYLTPNPDTPSELREPVHGGWRLTGPEDVPPGSKVDYRKAEPTALRSGRDDPMRSTHLLMRLIDPAERYFAAHQRLADEDQWLFLGDDVVPLALDGGGMEAAAPLEALRRRRSGPLERAAEVLLQEGAVRLQLEDRRIDARMIRLRRGGWLLETGAVGPKGGGCSMTRMPRDLSGVDVAFLAEYLARAAAKG